MDKNPVNSRKIPTIFSTKNTYRKEIFKRIEGLDWLTISAQINQRLQDYFLNQSRLIIAGFNQCRGEPDISPFLHFWHQQGGICCLPVVTSSSQPLIFRVWDFEKPLIKGVYNILIPAETEPEVIPDVILTPLIAFDQHGTRLGKGAGYYDSTLKSLRMKSKKPLVIGIAAHQQFIKVLEKEPHDEPLDMVVTDKEIIRFE